MSGARTSHRILVTDDIDPDGIALLRSVPSFQVDALPTLSADDLLQRVADYDAIVVRSATKISEKVLRAAARLHVVGRAGAGLDNIALDAATERGVAVINAPAGNTVAVAELLFGGLIALLRHIPRADRAMHEGRWERGDLMGSELRGRTMGLVGFGRIGGAVAQRARAFGMEVVAFDPFIADDRFAGLQVRRADSLDALLAVAQVCSLHMPLTDETRGMIGAAQLARLPKGAVLANLARGGLIDEQALVAACGSGHLRGAVLDSFSTEPLKGDHPFRDAPNILLMPHLGASTAEAQRDVAVEVCEAVRDALLDGAHARAINLVGGAEDWQTVRPALNVARRLAAVARARLADDERRVVEEISIKVGADFTTASRLLLTAAAAGAMEGALEGDRLNLINARGVAAARGIELALSEGGDSPPPRTIDVRVRASGDELRVSGVVPLEGHPRLTRLGPYQVDVALRGPLIILTNHDVPGVIGRVGTALGAAHINIAEYHQARAAQGGEALAVIAVDGAVPPGVRDSLLGLNDIRTATIIRFGDE